jgi:hypothetical protein
VGDIASGEQQQANSQGLSVQTLFQHSSFPGEARQSNERNTRRRVARRRTEWPVRFVPQGAVMAATFACSPQRGKGVFSTRPVDHRNATSRNILNEKSKFTIYEGSS